MTEHLPECPILKPCCDDEESPEHGFCLNDFGRCLHCMAKCICDALRACEQRAIAAAVQRVEALPHSLECVTRDTHYSRPCNCLHGDALDAIKGDQR